MSAARGSAHTLGGKENDPVAKLNIFVDGTRLLVQCAAGGSMAQLRKCAVSLFWHDGCSQSAGRDGDVAYARWWCDAGP